MNRIDTAIKINHLIKWTVPFLLLSCSNNSISSLDSPLPQLYPQSCLEELDPKKLNSALKRCNKVIKKYPENPEPLNDRSMIYTLLGEINLACLDVAKALDLINSNKNQTDPLIRYEINIRQQSCMQRKNILDKD